MQHDMPDLERFIQHHASLLRTLIVFAPAQLTLPLSPSSDNDPKAIVLHLLQSPNPLHILLSLSAKNDE